MPIENLNLSGQIPEMVFGGIVGAIVAASIIFAILLVLGVYVYFALAWKTIAKKMNYEKSWLAWIPIANFAMILQLGGFHWAWIFLILIPIVGWIALFVLGVIATWRIFEARSYPGWFSLSMIIPQVGFILYLIAIGFAAWKNKKPVRAAGRVSATRRAGRRKRSKRR